MIIKIESHLLFLSLVNELTLEGVVRQGCNVYINSKGNKNLWEGRKKIKERMMFAKSKRLDGSKFENGLAYWSHICIVLTC